MKYISKGARPRALYQWQLANFDVPGAQYGTHDFPKADVHRSLVKEQGFICAYTMIGIDVGSSHIEHLKPQAVSREEGKLAETSDYNNMVTCYPREHRAGEPVLTYGAIFRGDEWDAKRFVTPLAASCEKRIRFAMDGQVHPAKPNDEGAKWTIDKLGLNDTKLKELRRAVIEGRGLSLVSEQPITRREAERVVAHICRPDGDGIFVPYCVALRHAAEEYIRVLDRAARRRKYAARSRKRGQR